MQTQLLTPPSLSIHKPVSFAAHLPLQQAPQPTFGAVGHKKGGSKVDRAFAIKHSRAFMKLCGGLNWMLYKGTFKVKNIKISPADHELLTKATNPKDAFFFGPNHPYFSLDWLIDKHLSGKYAPNMVSWADAGLVLGLLPATWFLRKNNVIPNNGGQKSFDYSVDAALAGHGTLLHTEGAVNWTNQHVQHTFDGIAQMGIQAAKKIIAKGSDQKVNLIPIPWRVQFTKDVTRGLHQQMNQMEKLLGLPVNADKSVEERFFALQTNVMEQHMKWYNIDPATIKGNYFERQDQYEAILLPPLEAKYPVDTSGGKDRQLHRIYTTIKKLVEAEPKGADGKDTPKRAALKKELGIMEEVKRFRVFSREAYNTPVLTQEQIFESLQRNYRDLSKADKLYMLRSYLPKPVGPLNVTIKPAEPIEVVALVKEAIAKDGEGFNADALAEKITVDFKKRMQDKLDVEYANVATEANVVKNPFYSQAATTVTLS